MKKHSSMALVVFAVCMVSYSGPMVKGALNEGASPIAVALLRMLAAAQVVWHFGLIRARERACCFVAFSQSHWLGAALFAGVALGFALK